ncbi:hypothetical protein PsYK624_100620 [Phanerochaete sordida]|uniref:Uncharacterized protein n=1 Tax=Phanerochaete sordida TaxID=48140 RepID=A0A9P3LH97_9APHY|nr:hypothetical protein PsYK624_100620 [Phanerochaete sordida]
MPSSPAPKHGRGTTRARGAARGAAPSHSPRTPPRTRSATALDATASPLRRSRRSATVEATKTHEGRASTRISTPSTRLGTPTLVSPESISASARVATPSRRVGTPTLVAPESISAPARLATQARVREGSPGEVSEDEDSESESEDEEMRDEPAAPTPAPAPPVAALYRAPQSEEELLRSQRPLTEVDQILDELARVPDPWREPTPGLLGWGELGPTSSFDYAFERMQGIGQDRARLARFAQKPKPPTAPGDEPLSLAELCQRFRSPTPEGYESLDIMQQFVDIPDDDVDMDGPGARAPAEEAFAADLPPGLSVADLVSTPSTRDVPLPAVVHGY